MKINVIFFLMLLNLSFAVFGQIPYWNTNTPLNAYRLQPDPQNRPIQYVDLDGDGDPDLLKTFTQNNIPVCWIDDDDDMKSGDIQGDMDNDCLMIDRNRDGNYAGSEDLVIDWNDTNNDGKADMQVIADYVAFEEKAPWGPGHYMWMLDLDKDNIFNYIDWNTFELKCWTHQGQADFLEDYHGKSILMKAHAAPNSITDLRLNWENPFLFYDEDNDGLTEMAIRLCDNPPIAKNRKLQNNIDNLKFTGKIDWCSLTFDLDNDNGPQNEFDFDMTLSFRGEGFDYMDQIHHFKNMRGLKDADFLFKDPRIRQLDNLIYPDHESAWDLIFNRGKWDKVYFSFDEDDDCNRWERVELYDPKSLFKSGIRNAGIDDNPQSDEVGDRGEWDMDNSGQGNLYVGKFDGRIHLYGAEWGAWRIDQNAQFYQGMGGLYDGYGPGRLHTGAKKFPTVKYTDTNNNGFIDEIAYDIDGDTIFEHNVSLLKLGLDDRCEEIKTKNLGYKGLALLNKKVAEGLWTNALKACTVAEKEGLNMSWYSLMRNPKSIQQKYSNGYWLQFYIYMDLMDLGVRRNDKDFLKQLDRAYFSGNWDLKNN
jgi:hypothetical protein